MTIGGLVLLLAQAQDTEKKIKKKDLPAPVLKAMEDYSKGVKARGYARETENGATFYEAELRIGGRTRDVTFDAAGNLVSVEQEVALDGIPPAARDAIRQGAAGGKIELVESVTRGGTTYYEAHIKSRGKETELKVTAEGTPVAP
jgi:uncharacterized membrane protein YkoI